MCHVLGDVTNQQSLQPIGMHTDPAVLQLQVAKPLNYAVNMSTVPQMTLARPTFNMTCSILRGWIKEKKCALFFI